MSSKMTNSTIAGLVETIVRLHAADPASVEALARVASERMHEIEVKKHDTASADTIMPSTLVRAVLDFIGGGLMQQGAGRDGPADPCRGSAAMSDWQPIETAPKDGTPIQAKIPGHGADNVIAYHYGFPNVEGDDDDCGAWVFVSDQEPPGGWTDGVCWAVNEDGVPSTQPTEWKPLPYRGDTNG